MSLWLCLYLARCKVFKMETLRTRSIAYSWYDAVARARQLAPADIRSQSRTSIWTFKYSFESVSAIDLAGSLVGIADVVTRSLKALVNLQSKFWSSSLVINLIIVQLTTLKDVLTHITVWITSSLLSILMHEQLIVDLQVRKKVVCRNYGDGATYRIT